MMMTISKFRTEAIENGVETLQERCHAASSKSGWWKDIDTGEPLELTQERVGDKLMLVVTEIAEAKEGHRKGLMDDHLPSRKMVEVELADAVIRIMDLAGAMDLDIAGAIIEKMAYNKTRADHKIENRKAEGIRKEAT